MYGINLYIILILRLYNMQNVICFQVEAEIENINKNLPLTSNGSKNESSLSENISGGRNRVRHSRYPKLNDLLNKISNLESLLPINMDLDEDEEDEEPDNIDQEMSPQTELTSFITTTTTTREPTEYAVKDEKPDDMETEDVEFEEYDDSDYGEDDEDDIANVDDSRSQALSEIVDRYFMSFDQVNMPEQDINRKETSNDELADYFEDWDYRQEYQGSQHFPQDSKWKQHSTRSQFAKPRTYHVISEADKSEIRRHKLMVEEEGSCQTPQKRVVSVQSFYPNHSKNYIPRCTILYHCGDDTGCCKFNWYTCTNKTSNRIQRKFFTRIIGHRGIYTQVETLVFYNHTECECMPKEREFILREDETTSKPFLGNVFASDNPASSLRSETEEPMALTKCKCPARFSSLIKEGDECACDCVSKQKDCVRLKRGKEYFGLNDRICILRSECEKPTCEFGDYMLKLGRCPRKQEKI